jgi:protein-S-isoprenylcysteine O-methyltransferase Ste14
MNPLVAHEPGRGYVEETRLNAALGDEYRRYAARRSRLVPGVW